MKISLFRRELTKHLTEFRSNTTQMSDLLTMLAAHESLGCRHWRQIGGGPARGPFGIELKTHDCVWENRDNILKRASSFNITRNAKLLETDLRYNVFIARQYLGMDSNPLPKGFIEMAHYCKSYWNRHGEATPEEYMRDLILWERGIIG